MKIILSLLLILTLATSCEAQKEHLSLKLSIGATYTITEHDTVITEEIAHGDPYVTNAFSSVTMTFTVKACGDSGYTVEEQFKHFWMKLVAEDRLWEINSDKRDNADPLITLLRSAMSRPLTVVVSKTGKISKVEGFEEAYMFALKELPTLSETQKQAFKAKLADLYNAKLIMDAVEGFTAIFPDTPAGKGEKWTTVTHGRGEGPRMNKLSTYELRDTSRAEYLINGSATLTTDKDAYREVKGVPAKFDLTGTATDAFRLNKQTNWIVEGTTRQRVSGNVILQDNPVVPGGMTIAMTITLWSVFSGNESDTD